ncbi:DUF2931 family protein [Gynuella sp.]|uniref:DUF2931 family protein n=1 Tax=Gynuella sp. TaxID=2969146 RepID=UPI003D10B3B9
MLKHAIWISLLLIVISACEASDTYDYGFAEGGIGGHGWPIWVEKLVFNESWGVPVGNLSGQTEEDERPPFGTIASFNEIPLPHSAWARWFSYRNQTFYEITVGISKTKQEQIKQWFKQYPTTKYSHTLSTGFAGQGEIQIWWTAMCIRPSCPKDHLEEHYFELIPRIPAIVAEGDPSQYRERTKGEIKDGTIPAEALDLLPPETALY